MLSGHELTHNFRFGNDAIVDFLPTPTPTFDVSAFERTFNDLIRRMKCDLLRCFVFTFFVCVVDSQPFSLQIASNWPHQIRDMQNNENISSNSVVKSNSMFGALKAAESKRSDDRLRWLTWLNDFVPSNADLMNDLVLGVCRANGGKCYVEMTRTTTCVWEIFVHEFNAWIHRNYCALNDFEAKTTPSTASYAINSKFNLPEACCALKTADNCDCSAGIRNDGM